MPTSRREEVVAVYYGQGGESIRKTATIMGLARTTVQDHIRDHKLEIGLNLEDKAKSSEDKSRIRALEKIIEDQQKAIDALRRTRKPAPKRMARVTRDTESFCRLIVPDVHGSLMDWEAYHAMLNDAAQLQPKEVVILGDFIDCSGFLAQHHVMGFVAQTTYSFEEDVATGNEALDQLQEAAPDADYHYLFGNHEDRLEKWVCTQTLRNPKDAKYIHDLFSIERLLRTEQRGIKTYRRSERYHGLNIPGTIKLGHCHFTHGISTSKNAAKVHVEQFAGNVVYGHTHRADSYAIRTVKDDVISAWNPGCLCQLQPTWASPNITGWSSGYAIQICQPSGEFLHINVPIIGGKSYLMDLTEKLSGKKKTRNTDKANSR